MNEVQLIQAMNYEVRGQRVMLDHDLAELYGVETSQLKRAVKRNIKRFEGDDFMFTLSIEEAEDLRSRCQIGTLNKRGSNIKYAPFAFTELGVAMLSSILHSDTAIEINRKIMRAFVGLRQLVTYAGANYAELKHAFHGNLFLVSIYQRKKSHNSLLFYS